MISEQEQTKATAPKWTRMPAALRLELERAAEAHWQEHRNRHYELVRDDPRFSAWTGTHLGYRGEKYFDRVMARARSSIERKLRLKRSRSDYASRVAVTSVEGGAPVPVAPPPAPATFENLLRDLERQRAWLKGELEWREVSDDPDDFERCKSLRAELRAVGKAILDLTKQYGPLKSGEAADLLVDLINQALRSDPALRNEIFAPLQKLVRDQTGLNAIEEAKP